MALVLQIFEVCIIPLLGILTTFLVRYFNQKSSEISSNLNDATAKKYLELLTSTIEHCVIATNQTYVNELKKQGAFDADAQMKALEMTKNAVLLILGEDIIKYLAELLGDFNTYLNTKIEAEVAKNKKETA